MRARLSFLYGVLLAIAIAPGSAPRAQTVTASLPAAQPAPPPRTVKDILDGLARQSANLAKLDGDRALADAPIPEGGDPTQRIKALHDRGLAAERVGRARQALDDLNAAVKLAEAAPYASKPKLVMDLAQVEIMSGNALRALELRKAAIASSTQMGQRIVWNANQAVFQTNLGDLEGADASLARAEEALREARSGRARASELVPFWQAAVLRARGAVLSTRGKPADAEAEYQRAVTILNGYGGRDLRDGEGREVTIQRFLHGTLMDRAINLMALDRPIEAEMMAREALTGRLSRSNAESGDIAYFLQRLSYVVGEQGRADDAIAIARAALDIYGRTGAPKESLPANMSRLRLATNLMLKRKWREARVEADAMRQNLTGEGDLWLRRFGGHPDLTLVALKTGDVTTAKTMAARYVQRATGRLGARHYNSAEANGLLAMAAAAEGKNKEALALYAQALPVLLARSRQSQEDSGGRAVQDFRRAQIL